jgi:hypothetical protein
MMDQIGHEVNPSEPLARFVLRRDHLSHGHVNYHAFLPPPSLRLSVTRRGLMTDGRLWELGHQTAAARQASGGVSISLLGAATVGAADVREIRPLRVAASPLPDHPEHADIVGWPEDKSEKKLLAMQLAAAAEFTPAPP